MLIRNSIAVLTLALPLLAQTEAEKASPETLFYKAYFLDTDGARSTAATKAALGLYQQFLAAAPTHEMASKAAYRAMILMYVQGDLDGARAFAKKHSALVTKAEADNSARRNERSEGDDAVATKLREAMQVAREAGDETESRRLADAMRRAGGRGRRGSTGRGQRGRGQGGFGRGQGGRGRRGRSVGASIPKIAEMSKQDAQKAVETFATSMERMIDMMAQRGQAEQADKLEGKLDKIQDLVDAGKLAEAQKLLDGMAAELGAMGGSRGGDSRRRGGERGAGGAGGERRRRGGEESGAGAGGGERRRRG